MPQQLVPESKQSFQHAIIIASNPETLFFRTQGGARSRLAIIMPRELCARKGRQSCTAKNGRHHVANLTCCNSAFTERFGIKLILASSGD